VTAAGPPGVWGSTLTCRDVELANGDSDADADGDCDGAGEGLRPVCVPRRTDARLLPELDSAAGVDPGPAATDDPVAGEMNPPLTALALGGADGVLCSSASDMGTGEAIA
jgi:hypothetical protein